MQFSFNVKGKTPILPKFWAQAPLGVKTPLGPLTKILDPRLIPSCWKRKQMQISRLRTHIWGERPFVVSEHTHKEQYEADIRISEQNNSSVQIFVTWLCWHTRENISQFILWIWCHKLKHIFHIVCTCTIRVHVLLLNPKYCLRTRPSRINNAHDTPWTTPKGVMRNICFELFFPVNSHRMTWH